MKNNTLLRRWLSAPLLALSLVTASHAIAQDETTLKVATDPSFVPFEMMDKESKTLVGFDIDVINEIGKRSGFKVTYQTMDFNGVIPAVQTGNVDLAIAGITITEERQKIVDFSDPYYDSGLQILVRNDSDIKKLEDLKGKRIGVKIGSTSFDYLKEKLGDSAEVIPYPGGGAGMYLALLGFNVDAVFYDAPNVSYFSQTQGKGKTKTVGPIYEGQQYGIVLPKNSKWLETTNEALAAMKEDGTYDAIYKKWFGELPSDEE